MHCFRLIALAIDLKKRVTREDNTLRLIAGFYIFSKLERAKESNPRIKLGKLSFYH